MSLSIETFSLFVKLLDRFLSAYKVKSKYLECLAVACLYIACKVKEEDDNISITSEFLVDCECKCSIGELLRMEQTILSKFEWNVNDTTAIDFVYIYHSLLVNEFKRASSSREGGIENNNNNKAVPNNKWKDATNRKHFRAANEVEHKFGSGGGGEYVPPADLDFLHRVEYRLKQCLCVSELAESYRPQLMAFSLLSLEIDRY